MRTLQLKHPDACKVCSRTLAAGANAYWQRGLGARCALCGPWPLELDDYTVIVLPPGRAQGAVDSARKPMMTKRGAKSIAMKRRKNRKRRGGNG